MLNVSRNRPYHKMVVCIEIPEIAKSRGNSDCAINGSLSVAFLTSQQQILCNSLQKFTINKGSLSTKHLRIL